MNAEFFPFVHWCLSEIISGVWGFFLHYELISLNIFYVFSFIEMIILICAQISQTLISGNHFN